MMVRVSCGGSGWGAVLLLLALVCPKSAAAQVEPAASGAQGSSFDYEVAFERATLDYESGHYDRCVSAFRGLLGSPPAAASGELSERSTLHTYMSACLVASGRVELARQQFRVAILEDRQMRTPDPIVFPRSVVDLFVEVKGRLMGTLRRQQEEELRRGREQVEERIRREGRERLRVLELERLLETETVIRKNEPWMAWVPYGLGQFHNGDNGLGWSLLAVEAALTVSALAATSIELGLHSRADGGRANLDPGELNRAIRGAHTVGTVSWIGLLVVISGGMLEANWSFRPEVNLGVRHRVRPSGPQTQSPIKSSAARGIDWQLTPYLSTRGLGVQGVF